MADGDPEDWPPQPEALRALDRCLRCPICLDIATGPVALACGHSFCSRCIRDALNVRIREGQPSVCPSCRKPCDQADLRPVVLLREAAAAWKEVRGMLLLQCLQAQQMQQPIGHEQQDIVRQQDCDKRQQPQQQHQQQQHMLQVHQLPGRSSRHATKNKQLQLRQQQQQQRERKRVSPDPPAEEEGFVITISDSEAAGNVGCDAEGGAEQTSGTTSAPEQPTTVAVDVLGGHLADGQHLAAAQLLVSQQPEHVAAGRLSGSSIRSCSNRRSSSNSSNGALPSAGRVSLSSSPATTADLLQDQRQQQQQFAIAAEALPTSSSVEDDSRSQDSDYEPEEAADGFAAAVTGGDDGRVAGQESDQDFEPVVQQSKRHKSCGLHRGDGAGKENRMAAQASDHQQEPQPQQQELLFATAQLPPPPPQQQQQQQQQAVPRQMLPRAARALRVQQPAVGYVACPICDLSVPQAFIHSHLDTCLAKADTQQQQQQSQPQPQQLPLQQQGPPISTASTTAAAARSCRAPLLGQGSGCGGGSKGGRTPSPAPMSGGSDGNAGAAGGAAAGGVVGPSVSKAGRAKVVAAAPLEAPPKLCFELLKERNLKMKLADLGLSCEGDKKACVDRYTAFRNYVLSLKDSSSTMSLVQAAAAFTRQQRSIARAAARPQSLDASLAAAAAGKTGAGCGVTNGSTKAEGDVDLLIKDHSYAALIKQTRVRMLENKIRQLQQQEQQQEQQQKQLQEQQQKQLQEQQQEQHRV